MLQKKGCKETSNFPSQGAAAAAALQQADTSGLTSEQQLMLMYGHHSDETLRQLAAYNSREALAAATAAGSADACAPPHSPQHTMPMSSLSDGAPVAAAAAANAAAAATNAAAAASHQALSAPLFGMLTGGLNDMQRQQQQQANAAWLAGALVDEPMGQAEVLMALQVLEDASDPLPRLNAASASSARGARAAAAATPAGPAPGSGEHTSCSVPLAQLDLAGAGARAAISPNLSMGGAPCKVENLGGLPGSFFQSLGLPLQRPQSAAPAAAPQQQQGGAKSSRLKWLIQELQQELDVCSPVELESLDNDELSTLLCAALAPSAAGAAAVAAAAGTRAAAPQHGSNSGAAATLASILGQAQSQAAQTMQTAALSADTGMPAGFGPAQVAAPVMGLQVQKAQVMQLQHKLQQLQMQLQMTKDGGNGTPVQSQTPPPGAMRNMSSAASNAASASEFHDVYRSLSCVSDASLRGAGSGIPLAPLVRLTFGGGASTAMQMSSMQTQHNPAGHNPAGSMAALAQGMLKAPGAPAAVPASVGMSGAWGSGNMNNNRAAALELMAQQQHQQQQHARLQQMQQQQQQAALTMPSSAPMLAQDSTAAASQFLALQNQLKVMESEMMYLMAQQSAVAR
jgi:hypothetical protein